MKATHRKVSTHHSSKRQFAKKPDTLTNLPNLLELEKFVNETVIGQEEVVRSFVKVTEAKIFLRLLAFFYIKNMLKYILGDKFV